MKTLILTIATFISTLGLSQSVVVNDPFPITNDYSNWWFTENAGIYDYGNGDTVATTNIANISYPNSTISWMYSPIYIIDSNNVCSGLTLTFDLAGYVEDGFDFLYFQYRSGVYSAVTTTWITEQIWTGVNNLTYTFTIPTNITDIQFRFGLVADGSVNTYFYQGTTYVMYYDISNWNIFCSPSLPVEFLSFDVKCDGFQWIVNSEINNDYYSIEYSNDGYNWENVATVNGVGTTQEMQNYALSNRNKTGYYKLSQTDFDGTRVELDTKYLQCNNNKTVVSIYDLMGKRVDKNFNGIKIYLYEDGTTEKVF